MKNYNVIQKILGLFLIAVFIVGLISCGGECGKKSEDKSTTWAEKLGFPAGKKVIILHSDDAGMCDEANIATQYYLENDFIQSAAVMMPCPFAEDMINWAKANPKEDVGIHLTLTSEWKEYRWGTVTDSSEVPGLLDPDGKMWRSVQEVVMNASPEEVEKEIRAQIDAVLAMGYNPGHLDTHMGTLYGHPDFVKVFFKVAEEYGIPANAIDLSDSLVVNGFKAKGYPLDESVVKLAETYTLPKVDSFTSAPNAKTYEEKVESFKQLIQSLKPGLTEIIFHPSVETDTLKSITGSWQQRVWEAKMFADEDLIKFFKDEEIIFTNWVEIMEKFKEIEN